MRETAEERLEAGRQSEANEGGKDKPLAEVRANGLVANFFPGPRIPSATYRLQFSPSFGYRAAQRVVTYLHNLGITDCYTSPLLKAHPGSTHGYDVCDHNTLNPAFGTEADYERLVGALIDRGMGQIMDFVPNHMGIAGDANEAWTDVLENGQGSPYARFFDIDWHPLMAGEWLENKVLLPILGEPYGKVLESQQLQLGFSEGLFHVSYQGRKLPIDPSSEIDLLSFPLERVAARLGDDSEFLQELQSIATAINHLPRHTDTSDEKVAERQREKEVIRRRLANLCQNCQIIADEIDQTVRLYNGVSGDSSSFDNLDRLLNNQAYRLAYWRVAADEINYRRFFDINDLAAVRVEQPAVFAQTHRLLLRLLKEGKVTGVRIDHPDGLWDPKAYFMELQRSYLRHLRDRAVSESDGSGSTAESAVDLEPELALRANDSGSRGHDHSLLPLYVIVEKILSRGERLHQDWPVYGTTGYEFANAVNGIFVAAAHRRSFDNIYSNFVGGRSNYASLVNSSKKMIMLISLASEVNMLGYQLKRISATNRWYRDFTLNSLTFALREVIACLPVYRTYVREHDEIVDRQDKAYIEAAIAEAKKRNPRTPGATFDFIGDMLLGRHDGQILPSDRAERERFVMKLQQTTGPVMAKGVEDTVYYVYNRLSSLNEVGGNPQQFGTPVAAFHRQNNERKRCWPHSLTCTSTHDTKRSEDVRARINVLSEIPRDWRDALRRWSKLNRDKKLIVDGVEAPDPNEEYLLYQTLLGAWPIQINSLDEHEDLVSRIQAYILKAAKEAKVNTSWINPNAVYDDALQSFVRRILSDRESAAFLADFVAFQRKVSHFGAFNSLAQTLLKITSPGVPDIYQGTEIWDFSLVDPDNRRPVDFELRAQMLRRLQRQMQRDRTNLSKLAAELLESKEDGRIKLFVTYLSLQYRTSNQTLFATGSYLPLQAGGSKHNHLCAFARGLDKQLAIVVAPRLVVGLTGATMVTPIGEPIWGDTWIAMAHAKPGEAYRNIFTGQVVKIAKREGRLTLPASSLFADFPLALLEPLGADGR